MESLQALLRPVIRTMNKATRATRCESIENLYHRAHRTAYGNIGIMHTYTEPISSSAHTHTSVNTEHLTPMHTSFEMTIHT